MSKKKPVIHKNKKNRFERYKMLNFENVDFTNEIIEELLNYSDEEASVYYDYSGRNMFGKTTTGIVTCINSKEFIEIIIKVYNYNDVIQGEFTFDELYELIERIKFDSLGFDKIYYLK